MILEPSDPISNHHLMWQILFGGILGPLTPALPLLVLGVYPPPAISMSPPC